MHLAQAYFSAILPPKCFLRTDLHDWFYAARNFAMVDDYSYPAVPRWAYFTLQSATKVFLPTDPQRGPSVLAARLAVVKKVVRTIHAYTSTVETNNHASARAGWMPMRPPRSAHFVYFPRVQAQRAETPQKPSLVSMISEVLIGAARMIGWLADRFHDWTNARSLRSP